VTKVQENGDNVLKQEWVRPELKQLVAGAAESDDGAVADGSGQQLS
jgi:hypothetical protein